MAEQVKVEDFPKLLKELEKDYVGAHQTIHYLRNILRGKIPSLTILVDNWPEFKVVVCRTTGLEKHILCKRGYVIYSRGDGDVGKVLLEPGTMDWISDGLIVGQQENSSQSIYDAVAKRADVGYLKPTHQVEFFTLKEEDLVIYPVPDGLTLKTIPHSSVKTMFANWPYAEEVTEDYFHYLIDNYETVGLFGAEETILGYMMETQLGTVGMLRVIPEMRGRGYSKIILSQLCRLVLQHEEVCGSSIYPKNEISVNLHLKIGFKNSGTKEDWIDYYPNQLPTIDTK